MLSPNARAMLHTLQNQALGMLGDEHLNKEEKLIVYQTTDLQLKVTAIKLLDDISLQLDRLANR